MSGDERNADQWLESEFGLGLGFIDPVSRADRSMPPHQELAEIYAVPKTFDGSSEAGLVSPEETPVPKLLPGEVEEDRD
jgi:hypothetical protein